MIVFTTLTLKRQTMPSGHFPRAAAFSGLVLFVRRQTSQVCTQERDWMDDIGTRCPGPAQQQCLQRVGWRPSKAHKNVNMFGALCLSPKFAATQGLHHQHHHRHHHHHHHQHGCQDQYEQSHHSKKNTAVKGALRLVATLLAPMFQ